jgi:uncharacterized protein (TIGR02246 family)
MEVSQSDRRLVERVSEAMQAGPAGKEDMLALFTDDAVLVEPFSGERKTFEGIESIRERYTAMVAEPRPPDFRLQIDRIDTDGKQVITDWTCTSAVFPGPMKGESRYIIRDGKIQRLEIDLKSFPQPG